MNKLYPQQLDHNDNVIINLIYDVQIDFTKFCVHNRYRDLEFIGSGSQGIVCSALDTKYNRKVAIKKLIDPFSSVQDAKNAYRELKLMKHLNHKYIIKLFDAFTSSSIFDNQLINNKKFYSFLLPKSSNSIESTKNKLSQLEDLYLVMDYQPINLTHLNNYDLNHERLSYLIYQLFVACKYLHDLNIAHSDLKPPNIAIKNDFTINILDFGLARIKSESMTSLFVQSKHYRAPELLLDMQYTTKIDIKQCDIWSLGCIIGEMINKKKLFDGESKIDQWRIIVEKVGNPTKKFINKLPNSISNLIEKNLMKKEISKECYFEILFPDSSFNSYRDDNDQILIKQVRDLLMKMLVIDPDERINIDEALNHPYVFTWYNEDDFNYDKNLNLNEYLETGDKTIDDWKLMIFKELIDYIC